MQFHPIIINGETGWGITSRELALFLKRRHKHVLRDIRVFLSRKSLSYIVFHFEKKYWKNHFGVWPEYVLTAEAAEEFLLRRKAKAGPAATLKLK